MKRRTYYVTVTVDGRLVGNRLRYAPNSARKAGEDLLRDEGDGSGWVHSDVRDVAHDERVHTYYGGGHKATISVRDVTQGPM